MSTIPITHPNRIKQRDTVSVRDFGAVPGELTASEMHTALQAAIDRADELGVPVYVPPAPANYQIDEPLLLRSGTRQQPNIITLDGVIENTRTSGTSFLDQAFVFKMGEFNPVYFTDSWGAGTPITKYTIGSPSYTRVVTLDDTDTNRADGIAAISNGDIVFVASTTLYTESSVDIPAYFMVTEVENIDGGTGVITLADPISENIGSAVISLANNPGTNLSTVKSTQYTLAHCKISGKGGIVSNQSLLGPLGRTATYRVDMDIDFIRGRHGIFGNAFGFSRFRIRELDIQQQLCQFAGGSHNTTLDFLYSNHSGTAAGHIGLLLGENSRNCAVRGGTMIANGMASTSQVIKMIYTRNCSIELDRVVAPVVGGSATAFTNATVGAGTQPVCSDNRLTIRSSDFGSSLNRYITIGSGQTRFQIQDSVFEGTPAVDNISDSGTGTIAENVTYA